jgi:small subunit ribosomal protein S16
MRNTLGSTLAGADRWAHKLASPAFRGYDGEFSRYLKDLVMVVIRLARGGSKKRPFYNVVATDRQNRRDGRFIERVGYYNPVASGKEQGLLINVERVQHWTAHGAQVSPAVSRLIKAQADRAASAPQ